MQRSHMTPFRCERAGSHVGNLITDISLGPCGDGAQRISRVSVALSATRHFDLVPTIGIDTLKDVSFFQSKRADRHPAYQAGVLPAFYAGNWRYGFWRLYLNFAHVWSTRLR